MILNKKILPKVESMDLNIGEDMEKYEITDFKQEDENTHHGGGSKGKLFVYKRK